MYEYKAKYISNYDGDTVTLEIDLGFKIRHEIVVRLISVNTPELRGGTKKTKEEAKKIRDYVKDKLSNAYNITVVTRKDRKGKYGRYLAEVVYNGTNLNKELIDMGYTWEG